MCRDIRRAILVRYLRTKYELLTSVKTGTRIKRITSYQRLRRRNGSAVPLAGIPPPMACATFTSCKTGIIFDRPMGRPRSHCPISLKELSLSPMLTYTIPRSCTNLHGDGISNAGRWKDIIRLSPMRAKPRRDSRLNDDAYTRELATLCIMGLLYASLPTRRAIFIISRWRQRQEPA